MKKIVFLDEYSIAGRDLSSITSQGEYVAYENTSKTEVVERLKGAEVAITNKVVIDGEAMRQLPDLKLICVAATGMNNVDLEAAKELGFEDRDRILSIDNEAIGNAEEIGMKLLLSEADRNVTVVRNRDTVTFTIPMERLIAMREAREFAGMYTPIQLPYVVDGYSNEAVEALGYRVGDQIVAVDDVAACSGEVISPMLAERKGRVANVRVLRYETDSVALAERPVYVDIATPINEEGMIGIMLKEQPAVEFTHVDYTFWESIPAGVKSGIREVKSYWDQLVMMVNPDTKLYKEVGGFLSIGSVFPDTWNWLAFWNITALISIMLAVMNLLPIPVLDGGHVLFALYEIITRRKPNEKFLEVAQTIGFMLLMLLLIYANGNDIMNLFK